MQSVGDGAQLHLSKVSHLPKILDVQFVTAVGHNHLGPLPRQGIYNVAAQEPRTPKHCRCHPADLQSGTTGYE